MLAVIFLIVCLCFGVGLIHRAIPEEKQLVIIPLALMLGTVIGVWSVFLLNLFLPLQTAYAIGLYVLLLSAFFLLPLQHPRLLIPKVSIIDGIIFMLCILITTILVNQSLHFTPTGTLEIASNYWGDFDLHLPLIRSFAWGSNMPPALPYFPNANAAYHFLFDYWSALLTFGGLPLSYAFNIGSIISFSALLFIFYTFISTLFHKKKLVGIVSIVLFFLNSTLTFVEAYQKIHPKNLLTYFSKIFHNTQYFSSGPFTSDRVSIMWNLNVYLNQRHLLFALALGVSILYLLFLTMKKQLSIKKVIFFGILVGLLPFCSIHVFLCVMVVVGILGLFSLEQNPRILFIIPLAITLALPQILWLSYDVHNTIRFNPGFLSQRPLTLINFVTYWWYNLGLSLLTVPVGFFLANKEQKQWFIAFLGVFFIGNLFQFNNDMFNNHKLFNFWILFANGYTAYVIYVLLQKKQWWKWIFVPVLVFFLIFSGIMDLFVVKNDHFFTVADYGHNALVTWTADNTAPSAIFLIPTDGMYNPLRLAGRKTYGLSPRFADSQGYDIATRNTLIQQIYKATDETTTLTLLRENHITYVVLPATPTPGLTINTTFFITHFPIVYSDTNSRILAVQ